MFAYLIVEGTCTMCMCSVRASRSWERYLRIIPRATVAARKDLRRRSSPSSFKYPRARRRGIDGKKITDQRLKNVKKAQYCTGLLLKRHRVFFSEGHSRRNCGGVSKGNIFFNRQKNLQLSVFFTMTD